MGQAAHCLNEHTDERMNDQDGRAIPWLSGEVSIHLRSHKGIAPHPGTFQVALKLSATSQQ